MSMASDSTWHIQIQGRVQGVGFRPFVYQLACRMGLVGWVNNTADGVHIEFNATPAVAAQFYQAILASAPELARITAHSLEKTTTAVFEHFTIVASASNGSSALLISPDFALCEACRREVYDPANRRHNYAFTTCTHCGPRYSIIRELPYDREHTSMAPFAMCPLCAAEYHDPTNRRHFSQTNSCPQCPVLMSLFDNHQQLDEADQSRIIERVSNLWTAGKIVAIKGIGGYLLTCDAANDAAIQELRRRKYRPRKPFALMFPSFAQLQAEAAVSELERQELQSVAAPIVLLSVHENGRSQLALPAIAPGLSKIGAMLPYTPLFELLLLHFQQPIVATSGNISSAPIVYQNEVALHEFSALADYVLVHNREIIAPQDDSVVAYSRHAQQRIVLRRARGLAPSLNNQHSALPPATMLATGALLKSSFTLLHRQTPHVSQYLGNTDNYDAQRGYEAALQRLMAQFRAHPAVVLTDKHPDFFATHLGQQLARKYDSQLVSVQHHEAHFAAVLGEHRLFAEAEPILGVIWDGTGLGTDGQMWGGEFLLYQHGHFSRLAHLDYFDLFLGDKMATEPRLSAFSLCHELEGATAIIQPKFTPAEWRNYRQLITKASIRTSSVGRLFDAAASLLGLLDKSNFEGEASMLLEEQALTYFKSGWHIPAEWLTTDKLAQTFSPRFLLQQLLNKLQQGASEAEIAAWFHVRLVLIIQHAALLAKGHQICCSGGVFQNGLLVDLVVKILGPQHRLYFNQELSPNDENISFGQLQWFSHVRPIKPR